VIFLFTMNMESVNERNIHQVIGEHPAKSCEDLCKTLNTTDYISIKQYYKKNHPNPHLEDRGNLVLNCSLIGKVAEYQLSIGEKYDPV